jgi:hypothetical protein
MRLYLKRYSLFSCKSKICPFTKYAVELVAAHPARIFSSVVDHWRASSFDLLSPVKKPVTTLSLNSVWCFFMKPP